MFHVKGRAIVLVLSLGSAAVAMLAAQQPAAPAIQPQRDVPGKPRYTLPDAFLRRPLAPADQEYGAISGKTLKRYVEEITAIARKGRDDGNQFWGRISGTKYDVLAQDWVNARYKAAGLQSRTVELPMPPAWYPVSWAVSISGGGQPVTLKTAQPTISSPGTTADGLDLEAVWVGLGTDADFAGRNVRGKAAVVYAIPTPGIRSNSATTEGVPARAVKHGAAALIFVLGIPGNVTTQWYPVGASVPSFSVGNDDGKSLRQLIEGAAPDRPARLRIRLETRTDSGLKTANVIGVLPGNGSSSENVLIVAHRDSLFEGAVDNASGMAAAIGLADYFARQPREQRRRNLVFVSTPGHHVGGALGTLWLHEQRATELANTVLIINSEHVAAIETMDFTGQMRRTNTYRPFRWFLNGSDRLAKIMFGALDAFGVATLEEPDVRASGELGAIQSDAPSLYVLDSGPYTHSDFETADVVPEPTIEAVTRAFARIITEVNKIERKDLVAQTPSTR